MGHNNPLCLIVSGGDFWPVPAELREAAYIIACDRGYLHAQRMGLTPDLTVGDFDSAPPPETAAVLRYPSRKDDTDTLLALRQALERGYREIAVGCAFGGRFDHAFANVQAAAFAAARGARVRLLGEGTDALVFRDGVARFPRREGRSLSVFALSDRCAGVTVRGTEYECAGVTLENAFPLGVSNVWTRAEAEVSVEDGTLMAVQSRLREGEHI